MGRLNNTDSMEESFRKCRESFKLDREEYWIEKMGGLKITIEIVRKGGVE